MSLKLRVIVWAAAIGLLFCGPAAADGVRDFSPNRPGRADSPFTVPQGFFQIETDLANYTPDGQVWQTLDPLLIYGVSPQTDFEVSLGGLNSEQSTKGRTESFGDVTVRAKFNLAGDDGGPMTVSVIPYVKIPTARPPIGNGQVEGGVNVPVQFTLPYDFALIVEPEVAALKNALNQGKQASFTGIANVSHTIVGNLSGFVEIYRQTYTDSVTRPSTTFDFGLAYLLTKTVQLDFGADVGLNRDTPALNIYTGLAFRL